VKMPGSEFIKTTIKTKDDYSDKINQQMVLGASEICQSVAEFELANVRSSLLGR